MNYDQLTKLLNNKALIDRLHKNDTVTYFLINIDNFSTINDAFGYDVGDKVLIEISQYLKNLRQLRELCLDTVPIGLY